jgi:hypothetical protein
LLEREDEIARRLEKRQKILIARIRTVTLLRREY